MGTDFRNALSKKNSKGFAHPARPDGKEFQDRDRDLLIFSERMSKPD